MKKNLMITLGMLVFILLVGNQIGFANQDNQCAENFKAQQDGHGSTIYATNALLNTVNTGLVFDEICKFLGSEGLQISSANKQVGVISALQHVNNSQKTAPLNVVVESVNYGSKISITFLTPAGLRSNTDDVAKFFCQIIGKAAMQ